MPRLRAVGKTPHTASGNDVVGRLFKRGQLRSLGRHSADEVLAAARQYQAMHKAGGLKSYAEHLGTRDADLLHQVLIENRQFCDIASLEGRASKAGARYIGLSFRWALTMFAESLRQPKRRPEKWIDWINPSGTGDQGDPLPGRSALDRRRTAEQKMLSRREAVGWSPISVATGKRRRPR
jgi:hypothetical protein